MTLWQEYYRPTNIADALKLLNSSKGSACLIAGGTDLLLDIQQGRHVDVHTLVDITSIPELNLLGIQENELVIGAAVPLSKVATSPMVLEHAQALAEACSLIGGQQVRNVATLGGNVAHALPAADGTIAMMCLDTKAIISGFGEDRRVPLQELFLGAGKTALKINQEMIAGFVIPLKSKNQASAFKRVMRMQGIALPILNLSVWVMRERDFIQDIRISTGPVGAIPRRISEVEDLLRNGKIRDAINSNAIKTLEEQIPFRTSPNRATARYRHHLMRVLLIDTLVEAWKRAG